MNYKEMSIKELHEALVSKKISVLELTKEVIEECKKEFGSNFLVTLAEEEALKKASSIDAVKEEDYLFGIPYVTKDNISTKGIKTTGGSKILSNYVPPFNATITEKLDTANAVLIGKSTLDELGMGGTGLFAYNGEVRNPFDPTRIIGGSSSGSAYAVSKGIVPFATGTDTGDSIRKPASHARVVGFKPTYGSISRYGVLPYAPSLDHVGFMTKNIKDLAYLCDAAYGYDNKDFTSIENKHEFVKNIDTFNDKVKFGFLTNVEKHMTGKLHDDYIKLVSKIREDGHEVVNIDFRQDLLDAIPATYMMLSFAEAVSTNANLDGINFGIREPGKDFNEIMINSRTEGFGDTVKRRFIIGSMQLQQENQVEYFLKSKKVRRLIIEELNKVYQQCDILILPPTLSGPAKVEDVQSKIIEYKKITDSEFLHDLLILANLNGMPSVTLPFEELNGLPIGVNLNAKPKDDLKLLQAANYLEKLIYKERGDFND